MISVYHRWMPIQEREQWADNFFEEVDEKRDAWLTIAFVRFFRDDRRALFNRRCRVLWCLAWSILLSVVPVEFVHGRNRSRSHKHDLSNNFVAKPSTRRTLRRVQRQVKALKLCQPALLTKTAKQQPRY